MTDDWLVSVRRDLHRRPEPAWCEYYTLSRIVAAVESIGVDALHLGDEALEPADRMGVPDDAELEAWLERARNAGADAATLERIAGGHTGAVAVLDCGAGPTIGLRVDIDGLPIEESADPDHAPAAGGFASANEGYMHACGHDAHAAIGIGVLEAVADSDFSGTLKVFFQPAEEIVGGAASIAGGGHLDDVDHLLAVHVGLGHPTGTVVAGMEGFLAVSHLEATFTGASAHAGGRPETGDNAVQALATAVSNLYAIPRHSGGATRINAGVVEGGTAANIIPEHARLVAEVRGDTTALRDYMADRARSVLESAATMHGCDLDIERTADAPSAASDRELADLVAEVASGVDGVDSVVDRDSLGGSEDAAVLMQAVQERGGQACYVGIGTDHPGGHHTGTFDVDEASIRHGVGVLSGTIEAIASGRL